MNLTVRPVQLPLFVRIAAGYGLVLLVMLAIAALTLFRLQDATAVADRLSREDAPALQAIDDLKVQITNEQIAVNRFLLSSEATPRGREVFLGPYFQAHDVIFADLATLTGLEGDRGSAELTATLTKLHDEIQVVEAVSDQEIAAIRSGAPIEVASALDFSHADMVRSLAAAIGDHLALEIRQSAAAAQLSASESTRLVIIASILGAAFSLLVAMIVTLSISAPLRRLTANADRIAAGEMVEPPPSHRRDEIGSLSRAVTKMVRTLNHQAVELKRSNGDLEQFAYIASHDLQEPLRMVSGFTGLLKRRYAGKLDADADEFMGFAIGGVNRMQELINDLLSYSRVGREEVSAKPVDMRIVVDQALDNLQMAIEERSALISSGQLPTVLANHGMLVRLFQNLIGNALKFCKAERPIIRIQAEQRGTDWVFQLRTTESESIRNTRTESS
ncbi:MAG TPA: HAMP domain-containing protein [Candidatus Dormibacteraeota bacterium]|nr:HAMP domain-containing protein [Candidatus Dormibacteraeota bacterium]